jgi:biopolymer transport protein TolQ
MTLENSEQIINTQNPVVDLSILSLISSSDFVGKLVIFFLIVASIWTWAIIISKAIYFSLLKSKMKSFENTFWSGQVLDDLYEKVRKSINNPLSAVFVAAISECKKSSSSEMVKTDLLKIGKKERVLSTMNLSKNKVVEQLDKRLGFLATVGSAAPFIGLFGTVWGIMHSFQSIAASKNTTLAVVAPGIAEALLATAIGLFAAIPATIFYNYLISEVQDIENKIDNFIGELGTMISRAIDENKM